MHTVELDPIIERNPNAEPQDERSVSQEFIRGCVHEQIREAVTRVKAECRRDGLVEHFQMFCQRYFVNPRPTWQQIGQEYGVSWQVAKNRAWTVQERLKSALLEEFRLQDMTEIQVTDEVHEAFRLFQGYAGDSLGFQDTQS